MKLNINFDSKIALIGSRNVSRNLEQEISYNETLTVSEIFDVQFIDAQIQL